MLKKILAAAMLLIALPVVANAYTLKTWVQTVGGNIMVQGSAAPQTVTTGAVYKSYSTAKTVTVTATTGYSIKSVVKNGVPVVPTPTSPYITTASPADGALQTVVAQFSALPASLSATVDPGARGMVQPASYLSVKSGKQLSPLYFYFTPYTGQQVTGIDGLAGLPADSYTVTNAATKAPITSWPADVNVKVKVTFSTLQAGATTLVGHFSGTTLVVANAGPPQYVLPGRSQVVTLSGAASTGPITGYAWTQKVGPETVALSGAGTSTATFSAPSTPGLYKFDLTVTGSGTTSTATAIVNVSTDPAVVAWNQCGSCHKASGIGQNPNIYSLWSTSAHNAVSASSTAYPVMCYSCHIGAATGGHPGTPVATMQTVSPLTWKAAVDAGPAKAGEYFCLGTAVTGCHSPANIWTRDLSKSSHFANNNGSLCTSCHYNDSTGNIDIHNPAKTFEQGCGKCHAAPEEFAGSPHGSNPYNLFASECRTCHTGNVTLANTSTARASSLWPHKKRPQAHIPKRSSATSLQVYQRSMQMMTACMGSAAQRALPPPDDDLPDFDLGLPELGPGPAGPALPGSAAALPLPLGLQPTPRRQQGLGAAGGGFRGGQAAGWQQQEQPALQLRHGQLAAPRQLPASRTLQPAPAATWQHGGADGAMQQQHQAPVQGHLDEFGVSLEPSLSGGWIMHTLKTLARQAASW